MKNYLHFILLTSLFATFSNAEVFSQNTGDNNVLSKFYIKASTGYGIGINGRVVQSYTVNNNESNYYTGNTWKLGNGLYNYLTAGYSLNPHLAFELAIGYQYGTETQLISDWNNNQNTDIVKTVGNMWQVIPSVVYSTSFGKFTPYIRTGLIMGIPEFYTTTTGLGLNPPSSAESIEKTRFYGGNSLGIQSSIGCSLPVTTKFSVFAEVFMNDISFSPTNSNLTSYTINGKDSSSMLQVYQKEGVYKRSVPSSYGIDPNTVNQPFESNLVKNSFSSVGFSIGIKLNLGSISFANNKEPDSGPYSYARLQGGYGFMTDGDYYANIDPQNWTVVQNSEGKGIHFEIGYGYMVNSHFGFDLGLNYVSAQTFQYMHQFRNEVRFNQYQTITEAYTINGNMWQALPSVVFATQIDKFEPYARLGLILATGTIYSGTQNNDTTNQVWKYDGGVSIGFNSVLGIAYPISKNLDVYAEASFDNIYEVPQKGTLITSTVNGVDNLNSLSTQDKNMIFKTSYSDSDNADTNKPDVHYPIKYSFNCVAANIGIQVRF